MSNFMCDISKMNEHKVITKLEFFHQTSDFHLEGGGVLKELDIAYDVYGKLNDNKDNAILVIHALTGSSHACGYYEEGEEKGWWDDIIGPGKPLDTDRFCIVCSNNLGSCYGTTGPKSINPETGNPYALTFPIITIGDMVNAQKLLMTHLEIPFWHTVVGGSQGGMEVLEWAISYPEFVKRAIPIATTHRLSAQNLGFDAVGRTAVMEDINWQNGNYYGTGKFPASGLSVARMIAHITYLSEQSMHAKFGRKLRNTNTYSWDFDPEFAVETYLEYKGDSFVKRFDANSYLYLTKAMSYFDLGEKHGSLFAAMQKTHATFLIFSFNSDWLFPTSSSKDIVRALRKSGKEVSFVEIDTPYGHDAFLLEAKGGMTDILTGFLK